MGACHYESVTLKDVSDIGNKINGFFSTVFRLKYARLWFVNVCIEHSPQCCQIPRHLSTSGAVHLFSNCNRVIKLKLGLLRSSQDRKENCGISNSGFGAI